MLLTAAVTEFAARDVPLRDHVSIASCSSQGVKMCTSERWLRVDAEGMDAAIRRSTCHQKTEMFRIVIFPFVWV
jgi:hypothetical protein